MHKAIKLTGGLLLGLLLLVAVVLAYLVMTFDPNEYRDTITTRVKAATGRTLTLDDQLALQFFPWIGLKLGAATLSGPPTFGDEPFVSIRSAGIQVKVMPLLQHRLEIDTIMLDGLDVTLATNAAGEHNWEFSPQREAPTTGGQPGTATPEGDGMALAGLLINGVDISNAALHWRDAASATHYDLSALSLKSGAIRSGTPFDIELATTVSGTDLPREGLPLSLSARTTFAEDGRKLNIEKLRLQSGALDISGDINATLSDDGAQYDGRLYVAAFDPKRLLAQLDVSLPPFSDPQALQQVAADLTFNGDQGRLEIGDMTLQLDQTHFVGQTQLTLAPDFSADFTLALDNLDIDRYLPAQETTATKTTAPQTPAPAAALGLPVAALRTLDVNGKLTIDELTVAGLHASNIATTLTSDKGLIRLQPLRAELYRGKTDGHVELDARGKAPGFAVTQRLQGFQTEPFLKDLLDKDLLSGRADAQVELETGGNSVDELIGHLNGTARLSFEDGTLKGLNIADEIRRARARIENRPVPEKADLQTDFTALTATIAVNNGIASNNDLNIQAPYLRVGGNGTANLNKQTIDYRLDAKVVAEGTGQGGEDLESLRGTTIPIRIRGALTAPEIKLDSAAIREQLRARAKEKVQERVDERRDEIKDKIEDKLKQKLKKLF